MKENNYESNESENNNQTKKILLNNEQTAFKLDDSEQVDSKDYMMNRKSNCNSENEKDEKFNDNYWFKDFKKS